MKELSIEEKAKRYDEASKWMEGIYPTLTHEQQMEVEAFFQIFKESEDERIRKCVKYAIDKLFLKEKIVCDVRKDDIITWLEKQGQTFTQKDVDDAYLKGVCDTKQELEKQGEQKSIDPDTLIQQRVDALADIVAEQKPTDKIEPKFKIGDWVIDKQGIVHQIANVIENVTYHTYAYDIVGGGYFNDNTEGVRLWTIQDAKDGDVLAFKNNIGGIIICKSPTNYNTRSYCRLVNEHLIKREESGWDSTLLVPTTKEQCDLLFQKMKEEGYEWDAENKELKKIEQKSSWDEEDEEIHRKCICAMRASACGFPEEEKFVEQVDNWLKSLKGRYTWKPSDEHYELEEFAKIVRGNLTGISKAVQKLFEAKYLQLTGNKMYGGFKD